MERGRDPLRSCLCRGLTEKAGSNLDINLSELIWRQPKASPFKRPQCAIRPSLFILCFQLDLQLGLKRLSLFQEKASGLAA